MNLKIIFIIPFALLFFKCTSNKVNNSPKEQLKSEINDQVFDLNSPHKLLIQLYHSEEFDSLNNVIWSENISDCYSIPKSYDNLFHTNVDTVIYFKNCENIECAAVILSNYQVGIDNKKEVIIGSHFQGVDLGVALFKKVDDCWNIYKFNRELTSLGYFGEYRTGREDQGQISIEKFGENWNVLCFTDGIGGNTGEFWGTKQYFTLEEKFNFKISYDVVEYQYLNYSVLKEIFSYRYHHNYYFPDLENQNIFTIKMKPILKRHELYDLKLTIEEENRNVESNKLNSIKYSSKIFSYSNEYNIYLEKKN